MTSSLTINQLYDLNDVLTHALAAYGWNVRDEEDAEKLNDAVLDIAAKFFPPKKEES